MPVRNGIDNIDRVKALAGGARIGLITAPSGLTRDLRSTVDVLREETNLVALFSPEHGVRGDIAAGEKVDTYTDEYTGLPVYSIYGGGSRPTAEMLEQVDIMAIDVQDVGSRFYTFISTMRNVMEECASHNKAFLVLDRLNPINGVDVEGNILDMNFKSFIGIAPIPQRHGLTMGELARLMNSEYGIKCELLIAEVTGWDRRSYFDQSGLYWIPPSPNMPTPDTAALYNGTCFFEGTKLSEGRGTTKPFEMIGAPWLDAEKLAKTLNAQKLGGVLFRPAYFEPYFSKHKGELCRGVQVHITDRNALKPVALGLRMLKAVRDQNPDKFEWLPPFREGGRPFIDLLAGTDELRTSDIDMDMLLPKWESDARAFEQLRSKYLIY